MRRTTLGSVFAAMTMIFSLGLAAAQPANSTIVDNSKEYRTFECEPGDIPSTSMIEETQKDIKQVINPGYKDRYPSECRSWVKEYTVENEGNEIHYEIELLKYVGEEWEAVLTVQRNGEGVAYTDVSMEKLDVGGTNAQGRLRTRLPENFHITVQTSDGDLYLKGSR